MATKETRRVVGELDEKKEERELIIETTKALQPPNNEDIADFDPSTRGFDNKLLSIVGQIHDKQAQIISIANTAQYVAGCGTTSTTGVNQDLAQVKTWNLNTVGYTGDDPEGNVSYSTLSSSTIGIGSMNVYTNNGGSSIGTYYNLLGPGYGTSVDGVTAVTPTATDNANCTACKNAITTLNSEITTLRSQITPLVSDINSLKEERTELHRKRYQLAKTLVVIQEQIDKLESLLAILNDPDNDSLI